MQVIVIGSGLIGVTTAYFLRERGHEVTVIDRREGPALETSFANGALLTASMAEPWNAPRSWRVLLASLGRADSPMQLRFRALPSLMTWGIAFLRNSRVATFERSALSNLRMALYSLEMLKSIRQQTGIDYGHAASGSLRIFRDRAALDRASVAAERVQRQGLNFRVLSSEQTVELEPALAPIADQLAGGLHYATDQTGDAFRFCTELTEYLRLRGAEFRFNTEVSSLKTASGRITAVISGRDRLVADKYVVAAGSYSGVLLHGVGLRLAVRPAKGYSLTFSRRADQTTIRIPVVDDDLHAVIVGLPGAIRVAGTAEFAGYDLTLPKARIRNLMSLVGRILPWEQFDPAAAQPWCGLRAMTSDGVPIISTTPLQNLLVSTGHGHLGWTMAAGSGHLIADLICGGPAGIDPAAYSMTRFSV
jgi:D-amino-acid dehydrogenase